VEKPHLSALAGSAKSEMVRWEISIC